MIANTNRYDNETQMFVEPKREPDLGKLRFMRWLAKEGKFGHKVFGEPAGEYAGAQTPKEQEAAALASAKEILNLGQTQGGCERR